MPLGVARRLLYLQEQGIRQEGLTMTTPCTATLLDVVRAVSAHATSDAEIVATVAYLINSGKVRLCGTFAGARIDLAAPARAGLQHLPAPMHSLKAVILQGPQ